MAEIKTIHCDIETFSSVDLLKSEYISMSKQKILKFFCLATVSIMKI